MTASATAHPMFSGHFDLGQMRGEMAYPGGWRWTLTGTPDPLNAQPVRKVQITAVRSRLGTDLLPPWSGTPGFHADLVDPDFAPTWIGTLDRGSAVWTGVVMHRSGWRLAFGDGPERDGVIELHGTVRERTR